MKQTAVEWLVEQLARKNNEFQALTFYYDHKEEIEQAKQMEKEQIMMAHCHNRYLNNKIYYLTLNNKTYECSIKAFENSEQYYNETYKK